jgi:hypothetical protein
VSTPSTNLDSVLSKIRGLVAKAEHESTPPEEADACRRMADALMLKYTINEIEAESALPAAERSKPVIRVVNIGPDSDVTGYITWFMQELARHCRCKFRPYTSYTGDGWNAKVYGFEPDVQYFELMLTTIRLHMLGMLLPKLDRSDTLEENAYRLHNSGYNWLQIAEKYGWKKYQARYWGEYDGTTPPTDMKVPYWHKEHGWQPATQVGSRIKRAYQRAAKEHGDTVQIIAANGTTTYRKSAANGYVTMIVRRLRETQKSRQAGTELILRNRIDDLDLLFREDNPDLFEEKKEEPETNAKKPRKKVVYRPNKVNMDAYHRGSTHAQSADLNVNPRTPGQRTALGE